MATSTNELVKRLEELRTHLAIGNEANACWCIEEILQPLIEENTLPLGKVRDGYLCCPNGHPDHHSMTYVEPTTLSRKVVEFTSGTGNHEREGVIEIESEYYADDETDSTDGYLFCGAWIGEDQVLVGVPRYCNTAFKLPPEVQIEFV